MAIKLLIQDGKGRCKRNEKLDILVIAFLITIVDAGDWAKIDENTALDKQALF